MLQLDAVEADERKLIIEEFIQGGSSRQMSNSSGADVADPLVDGTVSIEHIPAAAVEHRSEPPQIAFLTDASPDKLAEFLVSEHPQTVSIVLAHLPPQRAADVVTRFAPEFQTEVLGRLARLDETDANAVCEVGQELKKLVDQMARASREQPKGLAVLEAILGAAIGKEREVLLARLDACDRRVARHLGCACQAHEHKSTAIQRSNSPGEEGREHIEHVFEHATAGGAVSDTVGKVPHVPFERPPVTDCTKPSDSASMLDFNDLIALNDIALAKVFRAADPGVTLLALTGASQQMVDRILRRLPLREARTFRRQMEQLGPTRLSDLEQAQQQLAGLAGRMADQGDILVPKYRRFTAAA